MASVVAPAGWHGGSATTPTYSAVWAAGPPSSSSAAAGITARFPGNLAKAGHAIVVAAIRAPGGRGGRVGSGHQQELASLARCACDRPRMSPRANFGTRFPRAFLAISWVWLVVLTILLGTVGVASVREAVDPTSAGRAGTAIVVECDDSHGKYRECFGSFSSRDGQMVVADTRIWGEDAAHPGDKFTAYGDPSSNTVTVAGSASSRFSDLYFTGVLLVVWLVAFWFRVVRPLRRRRARRPDVVSARTAQS